MAKVTSTQKVVLVFAIITILSLLVYDNKDNREQILETETTVKEEIPKLSQKEIIQNELDFIANGLDFTEFKTSVVDLQREVLLFQMWAGKIQDAKNSGDKEAIELASELEKKVKNIQISEFPKIRKAYIEEVAKKMWVEDIEVKGSGKGYSNINFTGGIFIQNRGIKTVNDAVYPVLKQFRFSKSIYKWYKEDTKSSYYTIFEGKDSDLVL